jgi:hypothetical protein
MRILSLPNIGALLLLLGACAPNTEVVDSWKDPNLQPRKFNKMLAVFISKDATMRRAAEDEMVHKVPSAVASYSVLPDGIVGDRARVKAWLQQGGYDGVVILRPVAVDKETTYVPGNTYVVPTGYRSMYGYWGTGWTYASDPGYVQQDQVVSIEGNVYSVDDEKLLWASRTKTYNPESVRNLVSDIVDATVRTMKRQKALATSGVARPADQPDQLSFVTVSAPAQRS